MKRRLFNLLAAVSLVMCVATAALWVRSYYAREVVLTQNQVPSEDAEIVVRRTLYATVAQGEMLISRSRSRRLLEDLDNPKAFDHFSIAFSSPTELRTADRYVPEAYPLKFVEWQYLGFGYDHVESKSESIHNFMLPIWSLCLMSALAPTLWFRWYGCRKRRTPPGMCPSCGYDLRASKDRCPECGAAIVEARNAE